MSPKSFQQKKAFLGKILDFKNQDQWHMAAYHSLNRTNIKYSKPRFRPDFFYLICAL